MASKTMCDSSTIVRKPFPKTMTVPLLHLIRPNLNLEKPFLEMASELQAAGDNQFAIALQDFPSYVRMLRRQGLLRIVAAALRDLRQRMHELAAGELSQVDAICATQQDSTSDIPKPQPGYVQRSTFWFLREDGRLIGCGDIRHRLTPFLKYEGGHIGIVIRPSERGKGHGVPAMRLLIKQARRMGIQRVLITCDADNEPSRRMIERSGGQFENWVVSHLGRKKLRYWVMPEDHCTSATD